MGTARREPNEVERGILKILTLYLSPLTAQSLLDSALERAGLAGPLLASDVARVVPLLERGSRLFMRSQSDADAAVEALGKMRFDARPAAAPLAGRAGATPLPVAPRPPAPLASPPPPPPPRPAMSSSVRMVAPAAARPAGRDAPASLRSGATSVAREVSPTMMVYGEELPLGGPPVVVPVRREDDIVRVRGEARRIGVELGASPTAQTQLATVVSELSRNIVLYAGGRGSVTLTLIEGPRRGVDIVASDEGPGIDDLRLILEGNYRSRLGLGLGLRGVRKLSSFFLLRSAPGAGTHVHVQMVIT